MPRLLVLFFIVGPAAMIAFSGNPPVQRTQEARVLETARQMMDGGVRAWMIPRLNGNLRLQKPPLAYWMAAGSFHLFGVNDFAGRLPFVLCGVLTLPLTYLIGRRLFDPAVALLGVCLLAGSYLFFRHMRLAETDAPATLFVTLAVYAILSATTHASNRNRLLFFHLAAAAMGLALLAKGAPVVYPILFLILACWAMKRNVIWAFIKSGAPLTLGVIALPWYVYIAQTVGLQTLLGEMQNNLEGGDHGKPPWAYAPWLVLATLPWTALAVVAIAGLTQNLWKKQATEPLKIMAAWMIAIALPLMIAGNKQVHYLLPLMPPTMLLIGWIVREAVAGHDARLTHITRIILRLTVSAMLIVTLIIVVGPMVLTVIMKRPMLHGNTTLWVVALMLILGCGLYRYAWPNLMRQTAVITATFVLVMPVLVGLLLPQFDREDPRVVAAEMRKRFGHPPMAFYGPNVSLPLCYNLRQAIPRAMDEKQLFDMQRQHKDLLVLVQSKSSITSSAPRPFVMVDAIENGDQVFYFHRVP